MDYDPKLTEQRCNPQQSSTHTLRLRTDGAKEMRQG